MKSVRVALVVLGLFLAQLILPAAPTVEAWLPENTVAVFTIPDVNVARNQFDENPWHRLWHDPAMQPFRDHYVSGMQRDLLDPFRDQAGWDLRAGAACVQGALAVALLAPAEEQLKFSDLELLLLADLGDRTGIAQDYIHALRPTSGEGTNGVPVTEQEGVALRSIAVPWPLADSERAPMRLWVGVTNTWLVAGTRAEDLAGLLRRMRGEGSGGIVQQPDFARDYESSLGGGTFYGWVNLRPWISAVLRLADAADATEPDEESIPMPPKRKMLEVAGLTAVTTLSFAVQESEAGTRTEFSLGTPATSRRGLLKMLELSVQDASPPPYVGTDVVRYERFRIDFRQTWSAFEQMLTDLFPQASGVLDLLFKAAGPEGESSDLREVLLALLGDDIVTYEYAPTSAQPAALAHPPRIVRLSSTNAAQLALSLKALTVLLPPPLTDVSVESLQGQDLYSVQLPRIELGNGLTTNVSRLSFGALSNGVAFSADRQLLERSLAGDERRAAPLRSLPGLDEASAEIGGMGLGCFRYYNVARAMPWRLTALRRETNFWQSVVGVAPATSVARNPIDRLNQWFDAQLLPPFEDIAAYFSFSVASAGADADRLFYRSFAPRPAAPEPREESPAQPPTPPPAPGSVTAAGQ
jgi:hypothetical protein